ncbi:MAG: GntR family transcriptional regulator [Planctomycetes bacterium]|nr:GntR family transcriptional regulator [Planctomycetota bacterium]
MVQGDLILQQDALERRSLAEQIYQKLKGMILSGKLKAGQHIAEESLTELFGVSRTPIREALRRLSEYGLVRIKPRSRVEVILLTESEAHDVMEVRSALEKLAVRLASRNAGADDLKNLRAIAGQCHKHLAAGDIGRTFETDSRFHLELARLGGNGVLLQSLDRLDAFVQLVRLVHCQSAQTISSALAMHDGLIEALAAGDVDRAMEIAERHSRFEPPPAGEKQA